MRPWDSRWTVEPCRSADFCKKGSSNQIRMHHPPIRSHSSRYSQLAQHESAKHVGNGKTSTLPVPDGHQFPGDGKARLLACRSVLCHHHVHHHLSHVLRTEMIVLPSTTISIRDPRKDASGGTDAPDRSRSDKRKATTKKGRPAMPDGPGPSGTGWSRHMTPNPIMRAKMDRTRPIHRRTMVV